MDQTPPSSTDQRRRLDQNNNNNSSSSDKDSKVSACTCTNISIMQLFHEMKQEFPKVPDHIVQQLVTENCHNRRACLEQLQKVVSSTVATPTMYPSKSIHSSSSSSSGNTQNSNSNNNQQSPQPETQRSPIINGTKWRGRSDSSQKMREMSERFENISISSSSETSMSSDVQKIITKRPTTLPLRRAPDPPTHSSATSTPSSTTSVSSFSSSQMHHNVVLDSTASKINDSLNLQLNVKVSPVSTKRPAPPPPPAKPLNNNSNNQRYTSHLSVQPEPPYTSMLDPKNNLMPLGGGATACTGTSGQRSYTNVKLTLRQPSSSLAPIDIQAGPQTLSYSSSSFNAQQGCESHLKITVAGNGESCIQAVRTAKNAPEVNQIDTTINIEGNYVMNDDNSQYRIISNPFIPQQLALPPSNDRRLTEGNIWSKFIY
jgi:TAK1-binding protein 2